MKVKDHFIEGYGDGWLRISEIATKKNMIFPSSVSLFLQISAHGFASVYWSKEFRNLVWIIAVVRASLLAQKLKWLPAMRETWVWSLGWEDSPGEGNGNPLQYSCLENPMYGGAWWATVHGVAKSQTRLSDFTIAAVKEAEDKLRFRHN